jgi:hypothetical protein
VTRRTKKTHLPAERQALEGRAAGMAALAASPQPWPGDSAWLPFVAPTWQCLRSLSRNVTPAYVDITSGGRTGTIGPYN